MPSFFVIWSGGVDSTCLIMRLLYEGFDVSAGYVKIANNAKKSLAEEYAISQMAPKLKRLYPKTFNYLGKIYTGHNHLANETRNLRYKQVPYFMHALMVAPITDYRAIGYVKGDSSISNIPKIKKVYDSYKNIMMGEKFPELVFPLQNIGKDEILRDMKIHAPKILAQCVFCEYPIGANFLPCGECTPCRRRTNELQKVAA